MRVTNIQATLSMMFITMGYSAAGEFLRVCYFPNWTRYRKNDAKYDVGDIDSSVCTHLIYAFAQIDISNKQLKAQEEWPEEGPSGKFSQFKNLKNINPSLKTLLSVGGEGDNKIMFEAVTKTTEILQSFSTSTVKFLRDRGFDGLDVDWEYPDASNRDMFVRLLQSLKNAFNADTTYPRLLLTFAGAAGKWNIDPGFNVPEIAKYVDFANLMTYDYTGKTAQLAAFNSPLYSRPDPRFNEFLSTNWTVHYWNTLGLPFSKIVVGITGVGRWLVLKNPANMDPGSEVTGEVRTGQYYGIHAGLAYPEICDMLKNTSTIKKFDEPQENPYLVNGDNWVGYENERSIQVKLDWMKGLGVAGIMFWSLDQDDFSGQKCDRGKYPLLKLIKSLTSTSATVTTQATKLTTRGSRSTTSTRSSTSSSLRISSGLTKLNVFTRRIFLVHCGNGKYPLLNLIKEQTTTTTTLNPTTSIITTPPATTKITETITQIPTEANGTANPATPSSTTGGSTTSSSDSSSTVSTITTEALPTEVTTEIKNILFPDDRDSASFNVFNSQILIVICTWTLFRQLLN